MEESAHVEFDVTLHSGDMFYLLRLDAPPNRIAPPYRYRDADEGHDQIQFHTSHCNIENFPTVERWVYV